MIPAAAWVGPTIDADSSPHRLAAICVLRKEGGGDLLLIRKNSRIEPCASSLSFAVTEARACSRVLKNLMASVASGCNSKPKSTSVNMPLVLSIRNSNCE